MAVLEAALSILSFSSSTASSKPHLFSRQTKPTSLCLRVPTVSPLSIPLRNNSRRLVSVFSTVAEEETPLTEEEKTEETQTANLKKKLFVFNLPWSMSVNDISNLFGECGTVTSVEIIKQKDGKNRGFAFVTMSSGEEAQSALEKFDSFQVSGRIIRVNFAKKFKKPPKPLPPSAASAGETRHKLYVSNLPWKARSTHLREFFTAADFNLVSARVVFADPGGRASGYGFVSFNTREEAEDAISKLDGKELMGRPINLKFSLRTAGESQDSNSTEDDNVSEEEASDTTEASEEKPVE